MLKVTARLILKIRGSDQGDQVTLWLFVRAKYLDTGLDPKRSVGTSPKVTAANLFLVFHNICYLVHVMITAADDLSNSATGNYNHIPITPQRSHLITRAEKV